MLKGLFYSMDNVGLISKCKKIRTTCTYSDQFCRNWQSLGYQDRQAVLDADSISNSTITLTLKIAMAADPPV